MVTVAKRSPVPLLSSSGDNTSLISSE